MKNAKFSQDRFKKCDAKGKRWARALLVSLGLQEIAESPTRNSKYDIEAKDEDGHTIRMEVEVKQDWGKKWTVKKTKEGWLVNGKEEQFPFPFPDIRYAARKKNNPVDFYVTFSGCGKHALLAMAKDVKRSKVKEIDNKHMSKEPFLVFRLVPKNRFAFLSLEDRRWVVSAHHKGLSPRVTTLSSLFGDSEMTIFDIYLGV